MNFIIVGMYIQGLISAAFLAKSGHKVKIIDVPSADYHEFYDGFKTGPLTHIPLHISKQTIDVLDLENYGFERSSNPVKNPFQSLPFYNQMKEMIKIFRQIEDARPTYQEKGWRDAWSAFEMGRLLADQGPEMQDIFAKIAKLSLEDFLNSFDMTDCDRAQIMAWCLLGAKTNPSAKETAMCLLPALECFEKSNDDDVLIVGSLHNIMRALKESAMACGVSVVMDKTIQSLNVKDGEVVDIILDDESIISADHYIVDCDPVILFDQYMGGYAPAPAFKNRIAPDNNKGQSIHIQMALSALPDEWTGNGLIARQSKQIFQAYQEFITDGVSAHPILSIVNVSADNASLAPQGQVSLGVVAQYFDPAQDLNAIDIKKMVTDVLRETYPDIEGKITHIEASTMSSFNGMPDFVGAMPLLRLFKIFSGHHALVYDTPLDNITMVGYGAAAPAHYHTRYAGQRISGLYQSK